MTENEVIAAIERATRLSDNTPDAMTREEIRDALKIGDSTAHRKIKAAIKAGTIEHVKTRRQGIDGVWRWVSGYRVVSQD